MNKHTLRCDIRGYLAGRNISLHRLAQESGVDSASLWRFVNNDNANLNTESLFRLWPFLYGEQKPLPVTLEGQPIDGAFVSPLSPATVAKPHKGKRHVE